MMERERNNQLRLEIVTPRPEQIRAILPTQGPAEGVR